MNCPKCRKLLVSAQGGCLLVCLEHGVMSKGPNADAATRTGNPESAIPGATPTDTLPKPRNSREGQQSAVLNDPSAGESLFAEEWEARYPNVFLMREHKPCLHREWRLDFTHLSSRVAIEIEGGGSYGHGRKNRYDGDIEKYNFLAYDGWRLLRFTPAMLSKDAERCCRLVMETITRGRNSDSE